MDDFSKRLATSSRDPMSPSLAWEDYGSTARRWCVIDAHESPDLRRQTLRRGGRGTGSPPPSEAKRDVERDDHVATRAFGPADPNRSWKLARLTSPYPNV